jgi:hypothetical protein
MRAFFLVVGAHAARFVSSVPSVAKPGLHKIDVRLIPSTVLLPAPPSLRRQPSFRLACAVPSVSVYQIIAKVTQFGDVLSQFVLSRRFSMWDTRFCHCSRTAEPPLGPRREGLEGGGLHLGYRGTSVGVKPCLYLTYSSGDPEEKRRCCRFAGFAQWRRRQSRD